MKLVFFSDTHGWHKYVKLPKGDVLIFCGDATTSQPIDLLDFLYWMSKQSHEYKIFVPGSHDRDCENDGPFYKSICKPMGITYLNNSGIKIWDKYFWGTAVQPEFNNWVFNFSPEKRKEYYDLIPDNTNILITHCPSFGILDKVGGKNTGCMLLEHKVKKLHNLLVHAFGHIHTGRVPRAKKKIGSTTFINCSLLNEKYELSFKPIIMEV